MKRMSNDERARGWIVDYSAARARAIEWLGDRYLLARPINVSERTAAHTWHTPSPPPQGAPGTAQRTS